MSLTEHQLKDKVKIILRNQSGNITRSRIYIIVKVELNSYLIEPLKRTKNDPQVSRLILIENQWQVENFDNNHLVIFPVQRSQVESTRILDFISQYGSQPKLTKSIHLSERKRLRRITYRIDEQHQSLKDIPRDIIHLTLANYHDLPIDIKDLPPQLIYLKFEGQFSKTLNRTSDSDRNSQYFFSHLPSSLETLILPGDFNLKLYTIENFQVIKRLPPNLTTLDLGHHFSQEIVIVFGNIQLLPSTLTDLKISSPNYKYPIASLVNNQVISFLPSNLENLEIHLPQQYTDVSGISDPIAVFPPYLRKLTLYGKYNGPLEYTIDEQLITLPDSLTYLYLDDHYNQPINHFPRSLIQLILGNKFNQPINLRASKGLKTLYFGPDFSYPLEEDGNLLLPSSLESLGLGKNFNHPIEHFSSLINLKSLKFDGQFDQPVEVMRNGSTVSLLPPNLTHLYFSLNFNQSVNHLPSKLKYLGFDYLFNQPIDHLPPSLTHLDLSILFNQPVDHLPPNLTYLSFGMQFNQPIDHLPGSLRELDLGEDFNQPINHLPPNLISLRLGGQFNQSLNSLPSTLEELVLGESYNLPLISEDHIPFLPPSLIKITFGDQFNQSLDYLDDETGECYSVFPDSLEEINFSSYSQFDQRVHKWPPSLKLLRISADYQYLDSVPPEIEIEEEF